MRKVKLRIMKVIKYKFGTMNCIVQEDGTIKPEMMGLKGFVYKDEAHLLKGWGSNANRLRQLGRKLIKIYEDGTEVDITPIYKDK